MSKPPSEITKSYRKYGEGVGEKYKPYITTSEFNSSGTTSVIKDWKTGRDVHCLSQGEAYWFYILRWDDENIDIREQFPLDQKTFSKLAEENNIRISNHRMTTDFLVTRTDGSLHAYSVKLARDRLSDHTVKKLYLEKLYWMTKDVPFVVLFKEDADRVLVHNIRLVSRFYDPSTAVDKYSAIKHKIAIKEYVCDMKSSIIDVDRLNEIWEEYKYVQ